MSKILQTDLLSLILLSNPLRMAKHLFALRAFYLLRNRGKLMNMKQVCLATAATLALCVTASAGGVNNPSYSHEGHEHHHHDWSHGWYVGAGVNGDVANTNEQIEAIAPWYLYSFGSDGADFQQEDNDVGFDIYVGKRTHKHFAFELGYSWVGD